MIKNINFGNCYIDFTNSKQKKITIDTSKRKKNSIWGFKYFYYGFNSFLQVKDGIIVSFTVDEKENKTDEEKRRNVIKFDEDGEIVWIVEDKYKKITSFQNIIKENNDIMLHCAYSNYKLNPKDGTVEWISPKKGERPW